MIDDLSEFLGTIRAVAMLSPLGYGFKTTIGDAIAAGAYVLAHPTMAQRCPQIFAPALISVDTKAASRRTQIQQAISHLDQPIPIKDVNSCLKAVNYNMLASEFGKKCYENRENSPGSRLLNL